MKTLKRCALYIRVSGTEQSNSLEAQEARLKEYCKYHRIEVVEVIIDEHISGGKPIYMRPNGSKIKELIRTKRINAVVSAKQDRLFRNTIDALTTVDLWNKQNVSLHIVDMSGIAVDTVSATGKMIFTFLCAKDAHEREVTGERVKAVLSHKKKTLKPYSPAVYGFKVEGREISNEGKVINHGVLVKDEGQQEVIALMKELKSGGQSFREIAKYLNSNDIKPLRGESWSHSTISQILENNIHS